MRKILMSMISMGLMAFATSAQAGSATGATVVSATAVNSCTVNAGSTAAFGNYTGTQIDLTGGGGGGAGSVGFACNVAGAISIALDAGAHFSGGLRHMADGAGNFLAYELYQSNLLTTAFGDGSVSHPGPVRNITGLATFSSALPARMFGAANYVPGSYADTVGITVSF